MEDVLTVAHVHAPRQASPRKTRTPDHRDLVIKELADSEAALLDHLTDLELDRDAYRELALATFDALVALTEKYQELHAEHDQLKQTFRFFREASLLASGDVHD
jgi:hypothetical protein